MESKILWIGEQKDPVIKNREKDFVMDSVFNYYKDISPSLNYRTENLFLDNGAFTARMQGIDLDRNRVVAVQESFNPVYAIPLDFPFSPGDSVSHMKDLWFKTRENILYWQDCTTLRGRLVPSVHSWSKKSLYDNLEWMQKNVDSDMIALGSIVSSDFSDFTGFFGDRQPRKELIDMFSLAISGVRRLTDFKVHLLGTGSSPLTLHLTYYLGADSTDSSGYRRKAAYGNVIFPGTGEYYCGYGIASFGGKSNNNRGPAQVKALQSSCDCPICRSEPERLFNDWTARAIHNEYVMKMEAQNAQILLSIGEDEYEKYIDGIFSMNPDGTKKVSSLKYLWEYAKLKKRMYQISEII
ncbi:MAG: hypothetical protein WED07_12325 [Candidatus Freyarchaeum deiterrae]